MQARASSVPYEVLYVCVLCIVYRTAAVQCLQAVPQWASRRQANTLPTARQSAFYFFHSGTSATADSILFLLDC